tara:strand:- start:63 stop:236 length:174 start_codon:yes stop_codon:yes gene_type:complete
MSQKPEKFLHRPGFLILGLVGGILPVFFAESALENPTWNMLFGLVFVFLAFLPKKND